MAGGATSWYVCKVDAYSVSSVQKASFHIGVMTRLETLEVLRMASSCPDNCHVSGRPACGTRNGKCPQQEQIGHLFLWHATMEMKSKWWAVFTSISVKRRPACAISTFAQLAGSGHHSCSTKHQPPAKPRAWLLLKQGFSALGIHKQSLHSEKKHLDSWYSCFSIPVKYNLYWYFILDIISCRTSQLLVLLL